MTPLQIQTAAHLKQWMAENGYPTMHSLLKENLVSREQLAKYCDGRADIPHWFKMALNGLNCLNGGCKK